MRVLSNRENIFQTVNFARLTCSSHTALAIIISPLTLSAGQLPNIGRPLVITMRQDISFTAMYAFLCLNVRR